MRYVFRLSATALGKMDVVAPPKAHQRSPFIRGAITSFLSLPKQPLADRPHLRGRPADYKQVCAILTEDQVSAVKAAYPDVSVSVVIQAAVIAELRRVLAQRYKMEDSIMRDSRPADERDENPDADPRPTRN